MDVLKRLNNLDNVEKGNIVNEAALASKEPEDLPTTNIL